MMQAKSMTALFGAVAALVAMSAQAALVSADGGLWASTTIRTT